MGSPPGPHGCPPEERESVYDGWARVAARPESQGGLRRGGHSPRRRLCTVGARGTPASRPPWSQGPGGWARREGRRCARPPPGPAEAAREGGRADGGRTRGGLTANTGGPRGPGGCGRKAEGRATRGGPPCCGRLPPAGLGAPQTAGIRPRHEPITVSSRPHPRATANRSPRSPRARPRRRQVSARLRPARPRARRRGGRGLPRGGAAAGGREGRSRAKAARGQAS